MSYTGSVSIPGGIFVLPNVITNLGISHAEKEKGSLAVSVFSFSFIQGSTQPFVSHTAAEIGSSSTIPGPHVDQQGFLNKIGGKILALPSTRTTEM